MPRFIAETKETKSRGRWQSLAILVDTHENRVVGTFRKLSVAQAEAEKMNRAHAMVSGEEVG